MSGQLKSHRAKTKLKTQKRLKNELALVGHCEYSAKSPFPKQRTVILRGQSEQEETACLYEIVLCAPLMLRSNIYVRIEIKIVISAGRILNLAIRDRNLDLSWKKSQFLFLPAKFKILPDFNFYPEVHFNICDFLQSLFVHAGSQHCFRIFKTKFMELHVKVWFTVQDIRQLCVKRTGENKTESNGEAEIWKAEFPFYVPTYSMFNRGTFDSPGF